MPSVQTGSTTLGRVIVNEIKHRMSKLMSVDIGYVDAVSVNTSDESIDYTIRAIIPDKELALNNVPIMTNYIADDGGNLVIPQKGQLCVIAFLNGQAEDAVCLGFIRRTYDANNDQSGFSATKEAMVAGLKDTDYKLRLKDRTLIIESVNGAKMRLNNDGSLKLYNKDNYGIDVDASGNVVIRGVTINHTQTAGTW